MWTPYRALPIAPTPMQSSHHDFACSAYFQCNRKEKTETGSNTACMIHTRKHCSGHFGLALWVLTHCNRRSKFHTGEKQDKTQEPMSYRNLCLWFFICLWPEFWVYLGYRKANLAVNFRKKRKKKKTERYSEWFPALMRAETMRARGSKWRNSAHSVR